MRDSVLHLTLAAAVLVVTAVCGELLVRLLAGAPAHFLYSGGFRDVQTDWDVVYGVDDDGRRVNCRSRTVAAGARRLAAIGDSFVFGQGVEDCADIVSLLNRRSDHWVFENMGVLGAGVPAYVIVARDLVRSPIDGALVLFYGNDIASLARGRSPAGPLADRFSTLALLRKAKHFVLVRGLVREREGVEAGDAARVERPEWTYGGHHNNTAAGVRGNRSVLRWAVEPEQEAVAIFRERFAELAARLRERLDPEDVYIAMVPEGHVVSRRLRNFVVELGGETAPFGEPGSAYALVRALAERHGFHFIETFEAFREGGDALYHPHDLHWSPAGHRRMAALVAEALELPDGGAPAPVSDSPDDPTP